MINDIIIFGSHGLPYIAKCYGGDACKADPAHSLVSGFFAALNSFTAEYVEDELRTVEFKNSKIGFSRDGQVLIAIHTASNHNSNQLREDVDGLLGSFIEMYPSLVDEEEFSDSSKFTDFSEWLDNNFNPNPKKDLKKLLEKKKTSFWKKVRSIFA